tara:strand:- start:4984 stop:6894 length:1911 start_codon:yes stop_codon:yes gene_type:complete
MNIRKTFYSIIVLSLVSSYVHSKVFIPLKNQDIFKKNIVLKNLKKVSSKLNKLNSDFLDLNFELGVPFPEYHFIENFYGGSSYRYRRSYDGLSYLRVDTYEITPSYRYPSWLINRFPVSLILNSNQKLIYNRRFNSQEKNKLGALFLKPYLPFNARTVLKNMRPGDYFSMPLSINIGVGTSIVHFIANSPLMVGASSEFILSGQFIVDILLMNDKRVRLRLKSLNARKAQILGFLTPQFTMTEVRLVDGIIRDTIDFNLLTAGTELIDEKFILLDYVFNLNDQKARNAFNQMLIKSFKINSALKKNRQIISTTRIADQIATEDTNKPIEQKRVIKIFKGQIKALKQANFMGLSALIFNKNFYESFNKNYISFHSEDKIKQNYYFPTYFKFNSNRFLLGIQSDIKFTVLSGLYKLKNKTIQQYDSFGKFTFSRKFNLTKKDLIKTKKQLQKILPEDIYKNIPWQNLQTQKKIQNVLNFSQVLLSKDFFEYHKNISSQELKRKFYDYINKLKKNKIVKKGPRLSRRNPFYRRQVKKMISNIHAIFKVYNKKRNMKYVQKFFKLRKQRLFKEFGLGFLISLIPSKNVQQWLNFSFFLKGKNFSGLFFSYGDNSKHKLYTKLRSLQLSLANQSFDYKSLD